MIFPILPADLPDPGTMGGSAEPKTSSLAIPYLSQQQVTAMSQDGATTTPLTPQQVDHALTRSGPAPSHQPGTSAPAPGGITRVLDTPGGTIIAHCHAGQATLISWSPAQGYDSEKIHPGPAPAAAITFEAANTETRVRVDCPAGIPTAHTTTGPDADQDSD